MMMRGDMNKMISEVNQILEGVFARIETLEDRLAEVEGTPQPPQEVLMAKRGPGRPPGSKNKKKAA